jgi:hypothetical protein
MREVPHRANHRLPASRELDASELVSAVHDASVELLGYLEVLLPMRRDDGVGDLLVDVLAAADELRVLALMIMITDKAFFFRLLRAVEDGL